MEAILEGLGPPKVEYKAEDFVEEKKKGISPFDFINDINSGKKNLIVDDWSEKQYNPWIINRGLSFNLETIHQANAMNCRSHLPKAMQNTFLINTIRSKRRFDKWIKIVDDAEVEMIKEYYGYSNEKARQALTILSEKEKEYIKEKLYKGGRV
jgi:hypothetical protein